MGSFKEYKIVFVYKNSSNVLSISAENLIESEVWWHLACHLGLSCLDRDGYAMLSHSIRRVVESNGVSGVRIVNDSSGSLYIPKEMT
jgi:hypothetical protein